MHISHYDIVYKLNYFIKNFGHKFWQQKAFYLSPLHFLELAIYNIKMKTIEGRNAFFYLISYITSDPIGAWKCNFPRFQEITTDKPNNQPRIKKKIESTCLSKLRKKKKSKRVNREKSYTFKVDPRPGKFNMK